MLRQRRPVHGELRGLGLSPPALFPLLDSLRILPHPLLCRPQGVGVLLDSLLGRVERFEILARPFLHRLERLGVPAGSLLTRLERLRVLAHALTRELERLGVLSHPLLGRVQCLGVLAAALTRELDCLGVPSGAPVGDLQIPLHRFARVVQLGETLDRHLELADLRLERCRPLFVRRLGALGFGDTHEHLRELVGVGVSLFVHPCKLGFQRRNAGGHGVDLVAGHRPAPPLAQDEAAR